MKVNVEQAGPCRKVLHVEVSPEEVAAEFAAVVGEFARSASIRGFRPGHAPRPVVERHFAKEILDETRDRLMPRAYREALEQAKVKPLAVVDVTPATLARGQPFTFAASVDVPPEFSLPPYTAIPLSRQKTEVTDTDVDAALKELRQHGARYEAVADRPVRQGDLAQVNYTGAVGAQPIAELAPERPELAQGRDFWMVLGGRELVPGLAAALEGAAVGDTRDVTVTFPADYPVPALAGKTAIYHVEVKALREELLPALDAEFFKTAGVASEADLRAKLRENLDRAAAAAETSRLKSEILKWLLQSTDLADLPQSVVDDEARHIVQSIVRDNLRRGATKEDIEQHRDDIFNQAARSSNERVKLEYILSRIADERALTVEDAELNGHLDMLGQRYGLNRARIRAEFEKNNALDGLRRQLRGEKTLDYLLSVAAVEAA